MKKLILTKIFYIYKNYLYILIKLNLMTYNHKNNKLTKFIDKFSIIFKD